MNFYPQTLLHEIEFDTVRQHLATRAVTSHAKNRLLHLLPYGDAASAKTALIEVNEVLALYENGTSVPALSAAELDEILMRLRLKNAILLAEECMMVKDLVESYNNVHRFFFHQKELTKSLQHYFVGFEPNKEIPAEIDRVFDARGEVKTSASEELKSIRNQLSRQRATADRIFYKVVKKYEAAGILGNISETVYEDRRVLAVNAAYKAQAKGIFHGRSAKASLIFLEPSETIDINNEIALLIDEEQREIQRILKMLTAFIAVYRQDLADFAGIMHVVDFINAKAKYAYAEKAVLPKLSARPEVDIIQGINPVLRYFNGLKKKTVVPLNVILNQEQRILVISGPNAGGKSITLKTVGLLQLMVQSGLLLPVNARSTFGWFTNVMADIGDAQSIENELSTYSSKLSKMTHILSDATPETLVLIDEFGSGSDPELGSALAQVFLEEITKHGAFGVLTTHYNAIKALADSLPNVVNGSMEFNSKTFTPEYILNTGTPGSSYTFEVAQRVGIHHHLINRARQKLDARTVAVDKLLVAVQTEKNALAAAREQLHAKLEELNALKNQHTGRIKVLEDKLEKLQASATGQASALQWGKRMESLVNSYLKEKGAAKKKEVLDRFLKMLGERAGEVANANKKVAKVVNKQKAEKLKKLLEEPVAVGDKVRLLVSKQRGSILEIKKGKYVIVLGGNMSTTVERDKFVKEI